MSKLLPGENLILQDHPHWITVVKSLIVPVVLLVVAVVADLTLLGPDYGFYVPKLRTFLTIGVVALALLWLIVVWIRWQSITYTLSDQRITIQAGVSTARRRSSRLTACRTAPPGSRLSAASSATGVLRSTPRARREPRCSTTSRSLAISATRSSSSRRSGAVGRSRPRRHLLPRPRTQAASNQSPDQSSGQSSGQSRRPLAVLGFMGSG